MGAHAEVVLPSRLPPPREATPSARPSRVEARGGLTLPARQESRWDEQLIPALKRAPGSDGGWGVKSWHSTHGGAGQGNFLLDSGRGELFRAARSLTLRPWAPGRAQGA